MSLTTDQYKAIAVKAAKKYGIPVQPFLRQLTQESGWRPGVESPSHAKWIGQFIPSTAKAYGVHDDVSSIWGAAHYMSDNLKAYGSMERALSAYNSGKPDAYLDPNFAKGQTYNYVRNIMGGDNVDVPADTAAPAVTPAAATDPSVAPLPSAADIQAQNAATIRQTARQGLQDIATGKAKPTDNVADIASLVKTLKSSIPSVQVLPSGGGAPVTPDDGSLEAQAVDLAHKYIGVKYTWGGTTEKTGFDCSGLVMHIWDSLGVSIPHTTYEQWKTGKPVAQGHLKPGDAVFFRPGPRGPEHEALYIGGGKVIAASHSGTVVHVQDLADLMKSSKYVGARRFA